MARPKYIAYDVEGRVIANHLKSWVNLAQGVRESHPGQEFTIRRRDGQEVYALMNIVSLRVALDLACDALEAEGQAEGASA